MWLRGICQIPSGVSASRRLCRVCHMPETAQRVLANQYTKGRNTQTATSRSVRVRQRTRGCGCLNEPLLRKRSLVVAVVGNKDVRREVATPPGSRVVTTISRRWLSSIYFYRMEFGCGDCPHFPVELKAANERSLAGASRISRSSTGLRIPLK